MLSYKEYIIYMATKENKTDKFPIYKIFPRLVLGAAEMGISIFLLIGFKMNLGLAFSVYWVLSLFVLLPLLRCTKCYYYGKRCNTGWGLLTKAMFPKGDTDCFQSGYALSFILWPLRLLPIAVGLLNLIGGVEFLPDGLFGIYILIIVVHRIYYRSSNCQICHQKQVCPVYNIHVLTEKQEN